MDRKQRLEKEIQASIEDIKLLRIADESSSHSRGLETHYKIELVSVAFEGQSRVQRQRELMKLFDAEFASGLHSLALRLMTPSEWELQNSDLSTPGCSGGKAKA